MKLDCEIIKDLLPLYSDNVCSRKSREAVEEHLAECETCREELKSIGDQSAAFLKLEKGALIIGRYRHILLRKIVFFLVCILAFPLVNGIFAAFMGTAVQETVIFTLVSMLTFVYIPAVVRKKRFVWITVSTVLAPVIVMQGLGIFNLILNYPWQEEPEGILSVWFLLLFMPCCMYIALSVAMLIINKKREPLDPLRYRTAAFKAMIIETLCLYYCGFVSVCSSMTSSSYSDIFIGTVEITFPVFFLWMAFLIFRFCKKNIFIRLGIYSVIFGVFASNCHPVFESIWHGVSGVYWSFFPWLTIIIVSITVAAIFFVTGIVWEKKKHRLP